MKLTIRKPVVSIPHAAISKRLMLDSFLSAEELKRITFRENLRYWLEQTAECIADSVKMILCSKCLWLSILYTCFLFMWMRIVQVSIEELCGDVADRFCEQYFDFSPEYCGEKEK